MATAGSANLAIPRRMLRAGTIYAGSPADAQRVQLVNALIVMAIVITLAVSPYVLRSGDVLGWQLNLGSIVWLCLAYALNATGRAWSAALLITLVTPIVVAVQLVNGEIHGGAQIYLIPSALLPFLTFPSTATRIAIISSTCSSGLLIALAISSDVQADVLTAIQEHGARAELNHASVAAIVCLLGLYTWRLMRVSEEAVEREQRRSDSLLLDLFPRTIARRLQQGERIRAERHGDASVLFCRVLGLDAASSRSPDAPLLILSTLFARLDDVCSRHGVEKIKSFGDSYMAACGLPEPRPDHAEVLARAALDLLATASQFETLSASPISLRIGIHSGPVVAGIIGRRRATYDIWGDVVNTAQRMEAHGLSNSVQISATTFGKINHKFACEAREPLPLKGKLPERAYLLRAALSGKDVT